MISGSEPASSSQKVSNNPLAHYFLTVCITVLLLDPFHVQSVYSCLSRGWDVECMSPPPDGFVPPSTNSEVLAILEKSVVIILSWNLIAVPLSLILMAPCYLIGLYIEYHWQFRRGLKVAIFWMAIWLLAAAAFPLFVTLSELFNQLSPNVWSDVVDVMLSVLPAGLTCGLVYCGLIFLPRRRARNLQA